MKVSVKEFIQNKFLCFQELIQYINMLWQMTKNVTFLLYSPFDVLFSGVYRLT